MKWVYIIFKQLVLSIVYSWCKENLLIMKTVDSWIFLKEFPLQLCRYNSHVLSVVLSSFRDILFRKWEIPLDLPVIVAGGPERVCLWLPFAASLALVVARSTPDDVGRCSWDLPVGRGIRLGGVLLFIWNINCKMTN